MGQEIGQESRHQQPGPDTGQTSGAAPALARYIKGGLELNGTCSYSCLLPTTHQPPNRTCRPHGIQPRVKTDRLDLSPGPVAALDQSQNSNAPAVTREAEEDRDR